MRRIIIALLLLPALTIMAQEKIRVACIGNSVTYGYGHKNPSESSYPSQLAKMLGEDYTVGNFGKSGATLLNKGHRPYTQQKEFADAINFAPDIAVIHLGLNDTDPRNWPNYRNNFVSDYLALIDTLRSVNRKVKIYVCRMTPIFHWHKRFKAGTRDWHAQIQESIEETAEIAGATLIDLHDVLYSRPDLMPDALHPDAEGARLIAERVYSALTGDYGGTLSMPAIYSDNMVIQRDEPFTICGTEDAGAKIKAQLGNEKRKAVAGSDGRWSITFKPQKADGKSRTLTVESGAKRLTFKNIAVGEVWLCSGQSNMAFMIKESLHKEETLALCREKSVRLYDMKPRVITDNIEWAAEELEKLNRHEYYLPTKWQEPDESNVANFSAVAYYFGAMLADSLGVPVGLICNAVGGAPAEAFIGRRTLEHHPQLVDILYDWRKNEMIQDWCRGRAQQNIKKSSNPLQRHPYEPTYLYETGIAPIACYPIKGAIWYQGESNAHNAELHEEIFTTLVSCWRNTWKKPDMPFYFVQLSSIERPSWPHFRDSQRKLADKIDNCAFAVSSDKGHPGDVHPKEKKPVGERLARQALHNTYKKEITPCGPTITKAERKGNSIILTFAHSKGMTSSDGKPLRTFEVAAEKGLFYPAESVEILKDGKIRIKSCKVKIPARARYGWQPYTTANLVNSEGLPASTFETSVNK